MFDELNNILARYCDVNMDKIINRKYRIKNFSIEKLRDILSIMGNIERYKEKSFYIASASGGIAKRNHAFIATELGTGILKVAVYSEEGIINQHTSEGVLYEFERKIEKYIDAQE